MSQHSRIAGYGAPWRALQPALLALSPDGRWLAFTTYAVPSEDGNALYLLDLASLDETIRTAGSADPLLLARNVAPVSVLAWRPDGQYLLFATLDETGATSLGTFAMADKTRSRLPLAGYSVHEAAWSPDSRRIALLATAEEGQQIYLFSYQPDAPNIISDMRQLTRSTSTYRQLSWTPDGEEIVVVARDAAIAQDDEGSSRGVSDLLALQPESAEVRVLTEHNLAIDSYACTPDGRALAVIATAEQPLHQVYLVTRHGNVGDHTLAVSPDLEYEAYASPTNGSELRMALPGPYRPQWDAAGQRLYFLTQDQQEQTTALTRLDIVWRSHEQLTQAKGLITYIALITQYNQLVYVQRENDGSSGFYRIDLNQD